MSIAKFIRDIEQFFRYSTDAEPTTQQQFQEAMKNWIKTEEAIVDVTLWQPTTVYQVGNIVRTPSISSQYVLVCTTAGASGTEEPTYGTVSDGTVVTDGSVSWTIRQQATSQNSLPIAGGTLTGNVVIEKASPTQYFDNTNTTRGTAPSSAVNHVPIYGRDKNNANMWGIYSRYGTDKSNRVDLIAYKGTTTDTTWSGIGVGYNSAGNAFTYAPTPSVADDSTNIATTAYVKNCVPKSVGANTNPVYTNSSGVLVESNATVGSATQPVYMNGGTFTKCTYTLGKSVPSNAVFTDTKDITASSVAANGYVKFSNGLIIQWGYKAHTSSTTSVTFPISFASACYSVAICQYDSGDTGGADYYDSVCATPTKTGVKFSTSTDYTGFYYVAIGK